MLKRNVAGKHNLFMIRGKTGKIRFSGKTTIRNFVTFNASNGLIEFGENVGVNSYCSINAQVSVTIGNNSMLGEGVRIYDHNHKFDGKSLMSKLGYDRAPVSIGENVWIGSNTVIMKGVKIGNNSVVGAGSIVTKDIPPRTCFIGKQQPVLKEIVS